MKHIFLFLLALAPALALAQTGTVKDSVRVLTTAEIAQGNSKDSAHIYFIDTTWKKIRMDSLARFARVKLIGDRGDVTVSGADGLTWSVDNGAITGAKLATGAVDLTATTVTGTLPVSKGGTGSTTQNFVDLTTAQTVAGVKTFTDRMLISTNIESGAATTTRHFEINEGTNSGYFAIKDGTGAVNTFAPVFNSFASNQSTNGLGVYFFGGFNYLNDILNTEGAAWNFYARRDSAGIAQPIRNGNLFVFAGGPADDVKLKIDKDGNTIIKGGTTQPSEALHVVGNARITGLAGTGSRTVVADANGVMSAPTSTVEIKENISNSTYGLAETLKMNPVSFNYKNKYKYGDNKDIGFIAEDIASIIPEAVGSMEENSNIYLDMVKLIPVLTKAIQEQQAQIQALQQRIIQLENK